MGPTQTLTILFVDVVQSMESPLEAGQRIVAVVREQLEQHDGRVVEEHGAGATVAFTSAAAAVACAAALQRRLHQDGGVAGARIGVAAGEVTVDGDSVRGSAVNVAARAAAKAARGQILVTEICRQLAGSVPEVEFADGGRFRLPGVADPVRIFEAMWRDSAVRPIPSLERTPFVGREAEIGDLRRFIESAARGRGGMVLLAGEPGVGKSRLAGQIAAEARVRGLGTLIGGCYDTPGVAPLTPLTEMLGQALDALSHDDAREILGEDAARLSVLVPAIRDRFGAGEPPETAPEDRLRALLMSARDVLDRAAARRPMLLVIEDLHWADPETVAFLRHLADGIAGRRVVVVATSRTGDAAGTPFAEARDDLIGRRLAHQMTLQPFGDESVAAMVRSMVGRAPDAGFVSAITRETSGNPFFVEEMVRYLAEENRLVDDEGRLAKAIEIEPGRVPESVRMVIERRLERLGPATIRLLRAAAIAGRSVTMPLLIAVGEVEGDALMDAIDEAERAGVLVSHGDGHDMQFSFPHELTRQTILSAISGARRQQLHAWVADAIERVAADPRAASAEIAGHLEAAGPAADAGKAVHYLLEAGRQAFDAAAHGDALRRFDAVLRFAPAGDPARADALFLRGKVLHAQGESEPAAAALRDAMEAYAAAGNAPALGAAARLRIGAMSRLGQYQDSYDVARRAIELHGDERTPERAWLTGWLGFQYSEDGDPRAGEALMDEAVRDAGAFGPATIASTLCFRVAHHALWGGLEGAVADGTKAIALLREHRDTYQLAGARIAVAWALGFLGRFRELDVLSAEQGRDARLANHSQVILYAHFTQGLLALAADGDIPAYRSHLERVEDVSTVGSPGNRAHWLNHMAAAAHWMGDWDEAVRLHADAVALEPPSAWTGHAAGLYAGLLARNGDTARAMDVIATAEPFLPRTDAPVSVGSRLLLSSVVEALLDAGDHERAAALYPAMLELIDTGMILRAFHDFRLTRTIAGRAAAAAGRYDEAETHFTVALRHAEDLPVRFERPDVLRYHAAMLIERGDAARATAMLEEAADGFRRLRMVRHLDDTRALLDRARSAPAAAAPGRPAADEMRFVLRREGHFWSVGAGDGGARIKDSRGLRYIAVLVARPFTDFHVLDLVAMASGEAAGDPERDALRSGDAGEVLDAAARSAYRERLKILAADLEEAEQFADAGRAARARDEIEALTEQLASAAGLGGRSRRTGSAAERARVSVRNSVASALKTLDGVDPVMALHLRNAVKTGAFCSYGPDRSVSWAL